MNPEFPPASFDKDPANIEMLLLRELVTVTANRTAPAEWFETAFDWLSKIVSYEFGFALEFSSAKPHLSILAQHNRMPPTFRTDLETFELPAEYLQVLDTPESVPEIERALQGIRRILEGFHYGSPIFVPLLADGHALGVLTLVGNAHPETRETWDAQYAQAQSLLALTGYLLGSALRRARLEKQLEQTGQRYDSFVENGLEAIWEMDANFNLVYMNQAGLELIGLPWEAVRGHNMGVPLLNRTSKNPENRANLALFLKTLKGEGQVNNFHVPAMTPGGAITLSVSARVRRDAQGKLTGVEGTARNVTAHVQARRDLEQRSRELELLYELAMRLNKTMDPRLALRDVVEVVAKMLDADAIALGLMDEWAERFRLVAYNGVPEELVRAYDNAPCRRAAAQPDFDPASAASMIEYLMASRRVLTTQDFLQNPRFNRELTQRLGYQSFLSFPMMFETHVYGMVLVGSKRSVHIDAHGERLGSSISAQLGLALHTHHVVAEHERSALEAQALAQIGRKIQFAPRAEEALHAVARDIKTTLKADYVVIQLLREDYFEVVTATDLRESARLHGIAVYEHEILDSESPLVVNDSELPEVDSQQREILKGLNLRAAVSMRLYAHDHALGILFVNRDQPGHWPPEQIEFIRRVSQQIAYALENKRLLDESAKQLRIQRALENAARIIASVLEPEDALNAIADDLEQVFKVDYVGFHLLEENSLILVAESGGIDAPRQLPVAPHQLRILRELDTIVVNDRDGENLPPTQHEVLTRFGFCADIGTPMVVGNRAIGILYLSQNTKRVWTDVEVRLAETFAQQIAVALENVRLLKQSQEQVRDLRALARGAQLIATSRSLSDSLPFIAAEFRRVLRADYVGFHLVEREMLRVVTEPHHKLPVTTYPISNFHRLILDYGQRIVVTDIEVDGRDNDHRENMRNANMRADIAVGLISRNKPLGILFVGQATPRMWRESEIQVVAAFAQQIASVLDLVQVLNEREARVRELEMLTELHELAAMNLEEAALEDVALVPLRNLLNADAVGLSLLESDHLKPLRISNGRSYGKEMPLTATNRKIFASRQPFVMDAKNVPGMSAEEQTRFDFYGFQTVLSAPMLLANGPVGLLSVFFKTAQTFTDAEIRLVQTIANQLATAFANARLMEEHRQRVLRSAKLTDFGLFCNSIPDSMTLQHEVVRRICDMLGVHAASVRLVQDGWLTAGASHGYRNAPAREHAIAIEGRLHEILREQQPFEIADLNTATELPSHWRERHLEEGFNAGLIVPMSVSNQVTGVLSIFHHQPHAWVKLETQYAQTIGSILALALANLKEKEHAANKTQELQATMDSVFSGVLTTDAEGVILSWNREAERITGYPGAAMIGKRWDVDGPRVGTARRDDTLILEAMADRKACFGLATRYFTRADGQTITLREVATPLQDASNNIRGAVGAFWDRTEELQAERQKVDFINEMAHQLNTRLGAIALSAQQLLRGRLRENTRKQYTRVLSDSMQDLEEFQERFAAFELERFRDTPEEQAVDLKALIKEQITLFQVRKPRNLWKLHGEFDFVTADPVRLRTVLENLLDNACKYSPPRSQITIVAGCPTAQELVLKIHNKGTPIPEDVQPHLFERRQRGTNNVQGSGLGLWLVRTKLHEMGGEIEFTSDARQGTTFTITLRRETRSLPETTS